MNAKVKLVNVPIGKPIEVFGKRFTVLEHTDDGTLVLSNSIETRMPFRDECKTRAAPNDFRDSDICRYLNGEYLAELTNGTDNTDAIIDMEIDLKCTLGQHEYGTWKAKVGLLTLDQYGKYYDIIPKVDGCWWLATPFATPLRSPLTSNADYVWLVYTNGRYNCSYCSLSCGVRPALILDSSLSVSCHDVANDNATPLSEYSNEVLLEEIKRKVKTSLSEEVVNNDTH